MTFQAFLLGSAAWKLDLMKVPLVAPQIHYCDVGPLIQACSKETGRVPVTVFRQIADWMEEAANASGQQDALLRAMAFVELDDLDALPFDALNPVKTKDAGWPTVVAMLVLAFPEVHWVFLQAASDNDKWDKWAQEAHFCMKRDVSTAIEMRMRGYITLFDPAGLRERIRTNIYGLKEYGQHVPLRDMCALVVDDEDAYCYFNAYTAYRFGYRCTVVNSDKLLEEVMQPDINAFVLSFEDLFLRFADSTAQAGTGEHHLSNLKFRDNKYPGFCDIPHRTLVTVGSSDLKQQFDYLEKLIICHKRVGTFVGSDKEQITLSCNKVFKPIAGLFPLKIDSNLQENPRFHWPPVQENENKGGHSAPGPLHEIADRLLARARRTLESASDASRAVYAAVLATDAAEYLGLKTPTSSLEALSIKHESEVIAECSFLGMRRYLDVGSRLRDLRRILVEIGKQLDQRNREISVTSANLYIVDRLVARFREHNEFDEELQCLAEVRKLRWELRFGATLKAWRESWLRRSIAGLVRWANERRRRWEESSVGRRIQPYAARGADLAMRGADLAMASALWYAQSLLVKFSRFLSMVAAWILVFAGAFYGVVPCEDHKSLVSGSPIFDALVHALTAFIGVQPPHDGLGLLEAGVTVAAMVVGIFHIGLLISYLYGIVFRR